MEQLHFTWPYECFKCNDNLLTIHPPEDIFLAGIFCCSVVQILFLPCIDNVSHFIIAAAIFKTVYYKNEKKIKYPSNHLMYQRVYGNSILFTFRNQKCIYRKYKVYMIHFSGSTFFSKVINNDINWRKGRKYSVNFWLFITKMNKQFQLYWHIFVSW